MSEEKNMPVKFNPSDFEGIDLPTGELDYLDDNLVVLNTSEVSNTSFDGKKFKAGVDSVSELCGAISALVSVGITPSMALTYLSEREGTQVAIEMNKLNADVAVQTARYTEANLQKSML